MVAEWTTSLDAGSASRSIAYIGLRCQSAANRPARDPWSPHHPDLLPQGERGPGADGMGSAYTIRTMSPSRSSRQPHIWTAGALLVSLLPVAGAQEISKPELFGKTLEAARGALEHYGSGDDPEALRRIADIGYELAVQSDFRDFPFSFYLIDMPVPNAFALPGGQIFVTRGMLDLGLSDDMLACLLGHEIAHVTRRHGTRMQKRATLLNILSQALLVGVMVGVDDEPENPYDPYGRPGSRKGSLVQGAAATGMVFSELLLRNYSREFEDDADVIGQRLAAAAGSPLHTGYCRRPFCGINSSPRTPTAANGEEMSRSARRRRPLAV